MKLLFVANVDWYVISHRIKIIEEAVKSGWDVTVACEDTGEKHVILETGAKFIDLPFSRSGTNPIKELVVLYRFFRLYRRQKADVIHHVSLKPVIYGSFIARILKKPTVLNAVSGLGYVFTGKNKGSGMVQKAMLYIMNYGFNRNNLAFIFQNDDDYQELRQLGVVYEKNIINFIKGSGVNLSLYQDQGKEKSESEKVKILFPARMLWDKGIDELRTATEILKESYEGNATFILSGRADDGNKAGVPLSYLNKWTDGNYVRWIGHSENMIETFGEADIVVLPSYREGIPKSLIEASAMGKPIVTTNAVGCKECVDHMINGLLVPVKSSDELAKALVKLIDDPSLRIKMGKASRKKAEEEFDINSVVQKHLEIYQDLLTLAFKSKQVATTS
jgi:glycosyltransferase involved in cell wall biosynthesis